MPQHAQDRSVNLLLVHFLGQIFAWITASLCFQFQKPSVHPKVLSPDWPRCASLQLAWKRGASATTVHHYQSLPVSTPLTTFFLIFLCSCQWRKQHVDSWSYHHHTNLKLKALPYWKPVDPPAPHPPGRVIQHQTDHTSPACGVRHQEMSRAPWNTRNSWAKGRSQVPLSIGSNWTHNVLPKWVTVDCVYGFSCSQRSPHHL